ncbi:MAG: NAD-dependent epimerase/dehydratase family protein [Candidatus Thorarchaeota archaeon]|nr:NAD-dependent epimerase/dehydratase family protein [Candidatus Thorarchaeota archaeon]
MNFTEVLEKYNDKTVLITGGAGCIGGNLIMALVEAGSHKIVVLDDLSAAYRWNIPKHESVEFIEGSILDEQKLKQAFYTKPDFVFHLAAHFANQNSIDHPETDLMVNGMGTLKVLEYCRLSEPEGIVFASSGCSVYGSFAPLPFKEEFVSLSLDTPYQIHKLLGELYCNHYHHIYGLPIAMGRYFNVLGPGEVPGRYRNVIPNFFWRALHNKPLTLMGTGDETRDFCFVGDVVEANLRMGVTDAARGEAINIATGKETTVKELVDMVNAITGNDAETIQLPKRSWDLSNRRRASVEKIERLLGFVPKTSVRQGLEHVHNWFMENRITIEETLKPEMALW